MNKTKQTLKYISLDFFAGFISWLFFYYFRRNYIDPEHFNKLEKIYYDINLLWGLAVIPLFWILLHYLSGYYKNIYRKSRLTELFQTFGVSVIGVVIIFFSLLLDDYVESYRYYYKSFFVLLCLHFFITYSFRVVVTTRTNRKIQTRKIGFNTLLIGSNEKALDLYKNIMNNKISSGHKFVGFVNIYEKDNYCLCEYMPHLGSVDNLKNIIKEHQIEDIIIAVESQEHKELERVITKTEGESVIIKAIPDNCDILTGKVKIDALFDEPLVPISHELMPQWQMNFKRFMDVSVSVFVLVFFSPLYLFLAFGVKFSSPGPIFYSHYRVGKRGAPFKIFKFRSMRIDAEADGPALSSENDPRITNFGKFLRKMRLDEIPQFYNVLIGDMSLVGPRPERQFFIDQIVVKAPHYSHLLRVRPGITSWGQVKYGYAKDVDEMVQRLKYDIIYIENMSIYIDIKILIYTIRTVLLAKGL